MSIPAGETKSANITWKPGGGGSADFAGRCVWAGRSAGHRERVILRDRERRAERFVGVIWIFRILGGAWADDNSFEIPKADASVDPASPKANSDVNVSVSVNNKTDSDETMDLILVDESPGKNDAWLGETKDVSVGKQGKGSGKVEWVPTQSGSYKLGVMAFKGDQLLTRSSIADVTVDEGKAAATLGAVTVDPTSPQGEAAVQDDGQPAKQWNIGSQGPRSVCLRPECRREQFRRRAPIPGHDQGQQDRPERHRQRRPD